MNTNRVVGVVCEFNPFHKGHAWLLEQIRARCGENSLILCVMSGDFVQRGEPAVFSKYARAEAACLCGADLVAELPPRVSLSSAEGFAGGAVELLQNLGAETIAFGAETDNAENLMSLAEGMLSDEFNEAVRQRLQREPNQSYAAARENVVRELWGSPADLLRQPNCILGLEYCKAVLRSGRQTEICVVARKGAGHDETAEGELRSGSQLRQQLLAGENISEYVPSAMQRIIKREIADGRGPVSTAALEQVIFTRLRFMSPEEIDSLPDAADGLGHRILAAACSAGSLDELYETAKSKRFALARVRRVCWQAVLGLNTAAESGNVIPCARVLALSTRGRQYLKQGPISVPVVTKTADAARYSTECAKMIAECSQAHDIWVLGCSSTEARKGAEDFRTGPFIIKNSSII